MAESLGVYVFEKETKNTKRFKEANPEGAFAGTMYVQKSVLKGMGDPDKIEILIQPAS
jgi:hypothetical protein